MLESGLALSCWSLDRNPRSILCKSKAAKLINEMNRKATCEPWEIFIERAASICETLSLLFSGLWWSPGVGKWRGRGHYSPRLAGAKQGKERDPWGPKRRSWELDYSKARLGKTWWSRWYLNWCLKVDISIFLVFLGYYFGWGVAWGTIWDAKDWITINLKNQVSSILCFPSLHCLGYGIFQDAAYSHWTDLW